MQIAISERRENSQADLQAAFQSFGALSGHLSAAFESLSAEVMKLRLELGCARADKEHVAARLSALLHALPAGVLVLDPQGVIVDGNAAARELLGEPLIDESFAAVLDRAAANRGALPEHIELRSGRFVSISRRELAGDADVVVIADVTESRLSQLLLARQQRLLTLGELAAGLAHQIRTPLATALLYASQMKLPDRNPADLRRCADKTVESLEQLDRLVHDMLAFTHGGAARELISVAAVLEQVAQWLRPALRSGVRLTIRTDAPTLIVRANASSLISAVLNLATNALQAARGEVHLELLARRGPAGRAQIVVSDNGPGVPIELRERIFEQFFTTRSRGNGIGLAIVKSVVEAHQGTVRLADSASGASFVIDLPAEENT
jgi:two-component system sensor histidine kinase FlrB